MPDAQPALPVTPAAPPPAPPAGAAPAPVAPTTPPPAVPAGAPPPAAPAAGAAPDGQPPKPAAEPGKKPDDAPAAIEIKLPDGADKKFNPKTLDEFKAIMADSQTTAQQKAQAVVDLNLRAAEAHEKAITEQMQRNRVADLDKLKSDPKFGGAFFDKTRADARSILERSEHGKAVSTKLEAYGLDCDPDFTKLLAEFNSLIAEDSTSSRAPNAVPDVTSRPQTQTARMAKRYEDKNKK